MLLLQNFFKTNYSESLILRSHLPPEIKSYQQIQPVRWEKKQLFIEWKSTGKQAHINKVLVDDKHISEFTQDEIDLNYFILSQKAEIKILCE